MANPWDSEERGADLSEPVPPPETACPPSLAPVAGSLTGPQRVIRALWIRVLLRHLRAAYGLAGGGVVRYAKIILR